MLVSLLVVHAFLKVVMLFFTYKCNKCFTLHLACLEMAFSIQTELPGMLIAILPNLPSVHHITN
jgi:hypothetical protein